MNQDPVVPTHTHSLREHTASTVTIIVAISEGSGVIGHADRLPWDVPADYAHYLNAVRGATVIMGRKSFATFGADLTSRRCLVITRQTEWEHPTCPCEVSTCADLPSALEQATAHGDPIFVAGGQAIYEAALEGDHIDRLMISWIPGSHTGDRHFPPLPAKRFRLIAQSQRTGYRLCILERAPAPSRRRPR